MGQFQKVLKIIFLLILVSLENCESHRTLAYNHDTESGIDNPNWMSRIPDTTDLSEISIPGTHESMSRSGTWIAQCQTLPLKTQLTSGIRAFDIRCRHIQNNFAIHHGIVFQHIMFGDVLKIMVDFLKSNPSEVLLVRIKEEYDPVNNTREFSDTFESYRNETYFRDYIWIPNITGNTGFLKLKEVRGKIVFLDDFSDSENYGLNYNDEQKFDIQDHYYFHTNWDLYGKWVGVKGQLLKANRSTKGSREVFYLNYLSGSYGSFPFFVASGHVNPANGAHRLSTGLTTPGWKHSYPDFPRLACFLGICTIAFEGTNVLTYNLLSQNASKFRFVGVIFLDFPGDGLINSIIQINFQKSQSSFFSFYFISTLLISANIFLFFFIIGRLYYNSQSRGFNKEKPYSIWTNQ